MDYPFDEEASVLQQVWFGFMGMLTVFDDLLGVLKKPANTSELINLFMVILFALELGIIPSSVYKLEQIVPDLFTKKHLKPPLYPCFMLLPLALNIITKTYLFVATYPSVADQPTGSIALWCVIQIARMLGTSVYYFIPPFFFGVMASIFMDACEGVNKASSCLNPHMVYHEGTQLLGIYLKVQEGSQFGLFIQFTFKTLLTISVGFLLSVSGKCLSLAFFYVLIYVSSIVTSVLVLGYFGFIMDDCFKKFQETADTLRALYVKSKNVQFEKELLDLTQKIEKQAPFSALGFFSVDRSTLMAELGTILTYFIILIQADLC